MIPVNTGIVRSLSTWTGPAQLVLEREEARGVERQADLAEVAAERGEVDGAADGASTAGLVHRLLDLGLGLEHLVGAEVVQRLAAEPDQAEAVQVVEVGRDAVVVADPRLLADHVDARLDELGADV